MTIEPRIKALTRRIWEYTKFSKSNEDREDATATGVIKAVSLLQEGRPFGYALKAGQRAALDDLRKAFIWNDRKALDDEGVRLMRLTSPEISDNGPFLSYVLSSMTEEERAIAYAMANGEDQRAIAKRMGIHYSALKGKVWRTRQAMRQKFLGDSGEL